MTGQAVLRGIVSGVALFSLFACTNPDDLDRAPAYLGNFSLGHNVVVSPDLRQGPGSREATPEEWIDAMTKAVDERFRRFEGRKLYHFGINVEGYVLAVPGIPVVAAPKSLLVLNVTVWDDSLGSKLNEPAETFTVFEDISGDTIVGSGVTQTREEQITRLSRTAAKQIQQWMVAQNDEFGWFEDDNRPARFKPRGGAPRLLVGDMEPEPPRLAGLQNAIENALIAAGDGPIPP